MADQTKMEWCDSSLYRPAASGPQPMQPRDGDRIQARQRINVLVRTNKIDRPDDLPCADCGHIGTDRRHEYDHHHGYAAEHHYCVEPVCTTCHAVRDSMRKAQTRCKHGHELIGGNVILARNGTRHCRECRKAYDRGRRDAAWWREYRRARNGK